MSIFDMQATSVEPSAPRQTAGLWTDQQEAIFADVVGTPANMVIEARAGCGKSSTCREAMWRLKETQHDCRVGYAVFNKANADEFRADCPPGVNVGTIHAMGRAAINRAFPAELLTTKSYAILDSSPAGAKLPKWMRRAASIVAGHAKNYAIMPDDEDIETVLANIIAHHDINTWGKASSVIEWAIFVLEGSLKQTHIIDFDDMLWLPLALGLEFDPCDVMFLDEVQDWNATQHRLIPQLCPSGLIIAVGDSRQAIYAWRGADPESMLRLRDQFSARPTGMVERKLTLTFRCPQSHVALAQRIVPDIQAHASNREGVIVDGLELPNVMGRLQPGDKMLCPTNAPLISTAIQLLKMRRKVLVKGRGVSDSLLSVLRQAQPGATIAQTAVNVQRWSHKELDRLSEMEGVEDVVEGLLDRVAGLQAIMSSCDSPGDIEPLIHVLCADEFSANAINLSTIHRAKGSEADTVYLLQPPERTLEIEWQILQRENLQYVALTRSKSFLGFVTP